MKDKYLLIYTVKCDFTNMKQHHKVFNSISDMDNKVAYFNRVYGGEFNIIKKYKMAKEIETNKPSEQFWTKDMIEKAKIIACVKPTKEDKLKKKVRKILGFTKKGFENVTIKLILTNKNGKKDFLELLYKDTILSLSISKKETKIILECMKSIKKTPC
jgi:hypothetical protein